MPQALIFPANKPSSRADATILDRWVTDAFLGYAKRAAEGASRGGGTQDDLSRALEELVPILSIGLHEIVRQETQHCLERGVVLEKIWRTYAELFERALREARELLRRHKAKTARVEADLERTRAELAELEAKHPEQISKLSRTLAGKFEQRQTELEGQLRNLKAENQSLREHLREQTDSSQCWFPLFHRYKDDRLKRVLSLSGPVVPSSATPEARIAADFKRILTAMPPDGRRRVGFFISSLLGLRSGHLGGAVTLGGLTERRDQNRWRIEQLEARVRELKGGG